MDQRVTLRRTVSWRAQVYTSGQPFIAGRIVDLTSSGMALVADIPIPTGMTVDVRGLVPPREANTPPKVIALRARALYHVMAEGQFRTGLHVVQMDEAARQAIETIP